MSDYIREGCRPNFIDKTHWKLRYVTGKARAPKRTTPILYAGNLSESLTVRISMSDFRMKYFQVIKVSNINENFNFYSTRLVEDS